MTVLQKKNATPIIQESGPVGTDLEMIIGTIGDTQQFLAATHWFVAIDFFTDEELTTPAAPSGGTLEYLVITALSDVEATITAGTVTFPEVQTERNFASNPLKIIARPTGIVGAAFMRLRASGNIS